MRKSLILWLLILCAVAIPGCGSSDNVQQVSFDTVQKGSVSPKDLNAQLQISVIRNQTEWATFWNLLYTNYATKPALPSVDFLSNSIIAVTDSSRSSGGYSIVVDQIQTADSGVLVHVVQESPGHCGGVTLSFDQPFHIVKMPTFSGVANLELTQSVRSCDP